MRANKAQSPDEIRERYLGEIAPLLAAARNVDTLSPAQKKQVRKRVLRTVFGTRSQLLRFRLTPVMVGVGLLVAGGVAFATAERLGFIHRADQGPPNARATDADSPRRKGSRPNPGAQQGLGGAQGAPSEAQDGVPRSQAPDPLRLEPRSAGVPTSTQVVPPAPTAKPVALPELRAARPSSSPRPSTATAAVKATGGSGFARRTVKPAQQLALATPYLAEPAPSSTAVPPSSSLRGAPAPAMPPWAYSPPVSPVPPPVPPPPARQPIAAPASTPARSLAPPSPKVSVSDPVLFGQALRKLRNEHDPGEALATLQQHEQAYPRSAFSGERNALQVEALLALHRDREALQKLDGMRIEGLPRSGERFVVRGELRAAARRWLDAKADFDQALARVSGSPAWHERALWGRGVARLRCGEQQAGMADIERYHDTYPEGRFAAEASRFFPGK